MLQEKPLSNVLARGIAVSSPPASYEVISEELTRFGADSSPDKISGLLIEWVSGERKQGKVDSAVLDKVESLAHDDVFAAIGVIATTIGPSMVHRSMGTSINNLRKNVAFGLSQDEDKKLEKGIKSSTLTLGSEAHRTAELLMTMDRFWHAFPGTFDLVIKDDKVVEFIEKTKQIDSIQQGVLGDTNFDGIRVDKNTSGFSETTASSEETHKETRFIRLESPIKAPAADQSKLHWAFEVVKSGLKTIYEKKGSLPEKPTDIVKILKDEDLSVAFMQVMEVSHFLLGSENGLSQVAWEGSKGEISTKHINGFKSLDLLVLMRITLERFQGFKKVEKNQSSLIEINEGNMSVRYKYPSSENEHKRTGVQEVKAGQIDILKISFESEEKEEKGIDFDLIAPLPDPDQGSRLASLENYRKLFLGVVGGSGKEPNFSKLKTGNVHLAITLLSYMEATAGSKIVGSDQPVTWKARDVTRWRKKLESKLSSGNFGKNAGFGIKDAVKVIEKKFKKTRNLEVLFRELYIIYGDRIFTDLVVEVNDLKFPAGDGGWFSVYQANNLPQAKDAKQVESYLFKIASQLYRVKEWANQKLDVSKKKGVVSKSGTQTVDLKKVTSFIRKLNLQKRITGKLLYQTPSGEVDSEITLKKDYRSLSEQGKIAFRINPEKNDQLVEKIKVLRALKRILDTKLKGVESVTRVTEPMPKALEGLCIQNDGGIFLCIENLENILYQGLIESSEIVITQGAYIMDQVVRVFWVNNLTKDCPPLRISVNKKGRYSIDGFKDFGRITGKLLSAVDFESVTENSEDLYEFYKSKVWDLINFNLDNKVVYSQKGVVEQNDIGLGEPYPEASTKILWPDGSLRDQVPGKPIVCRWDGMTGRWFLDPELLQIAAESGSDRHDMVRLYELVKTKSRKNKQILCPIPTHSNLDKESRAAQWSLVHYNHILCRTPDCGGSIDISKALGIRKEWAPIKPGAENYEVANFRPLNEDRIRVIETVVDIADFFSQVDPSVRRYITEVRALSQENVGSVGYVPPWFAKSLYNLSKNRTFQEIFVEDGDLAMVQFVDQMHALGVQDTNGRFVSGVEEFLKRLSHLGDVGKALSVLSAKTIIEGLDYFSGDFLNSFIKSLYISSSL